MYSLAFGSHSAAEMHELLTKDRTIWYEFDLLDKNDVPLGKITAEGNIDYDATAGIQRCASLTIKEEKEIEKSGVWRGSRPREWKREGESLFLLLLLLLRE